MRFTKLQRLEIIWNERRKKKTLVKKFFRHIMDLYFSQQFKLILKTSVQFFGYAVNLNNLSLSLYLFLNSISSKLRLKRERFKNGNLRLTIFFSFFELRCALALLSINQLDNNRKTNLLMYTPLWQTPRARHYYLAGLSEHSLKLVGP